MNATAQILLAADEPPPVTVYNPNGSSPLLLVADHAGRTVPRALGRLGVADADYERHIAWDIGIAGVGRFLADALDADAHPAKLFAPRDRLQSAAKRLDLDPRDQRTHPHPGQCRL